MNKVLRHALTGSAIATGMMIAASPAQAACPAGTTTNPNDSRICLTGTTTTTTNTTGLLATDREALFFAGGVPTFFTVQSGATVNGFGAAWTQGDAGTNPTTVTNNGTIQVDVGLVPTAGGTGALSITSVASPVTYTGTGTITNLGVGHGLDVNLSGTASFTGTVSGNVTSGTGVYPAGGIGIAVDHTGTSGNVSVTAPVVTGGTTIRADYAGYGLVGGATTTGSFSVTNNATIASLTGAPGTLDWGIFINNNGTGAVTVVNNGAVGSATDRILQNGIEAIISNAASSAAINVSGTGALFTVSDAIDATTAGTGTVTVNYTGAINTTAGDGIDADSTTGALSVTTGAITAVGGDAVNTLSTTGNQTITIGGAVSGEDGVEATATTGTLTVNVNGGNVTGTDDGIDLNNTNATATAQTVTIAAGRTVSGGSNAIESTLAAGGTLTVNNNGTLTTTAAGGDAIFTTSLNGATVINNNAGATINGDLDLTDGIDTVNNRGTLNSFAGSAFFGGNDVITNFNTGVINLDGAVDFGAGTDTFANNTGGVINILANSSLLNLEVFTQNGRINFSAGTTLTGPPIAFVNGPGSFIDTAGNATIAGFTSMTNNGTIDLAAGTFTVPAGAFTNAATGIIIADEGATTITGQTSFTNNGVIDLLDGVRNDNLTINSSYTGAGRLQVDVDGTTADTLIINGNVSGQTSIDVNTIGLGVFDPDGILVVDVTGAFTSAEGSFIIGEEVGNPLINYDVERIGQDFFLVTLLDPETAFVPLAATGLIREMWYQSADEVFAHTLAPTAKLGLSVWGNVYGSQRRTGATNSQTVNGVQYDADNNIEIDRYGVQGGVGYGFGMAEVGLTAGYANAQANGDGEFDADGFNIGLYGRYGALTGFHAEALFKHDSYDVEFDGLFDGNDVDASSTGIDGSVGYRMAMGVVPSIDLFAGLSHVWSDMDGVSAFGFGYDFDDMTSTRGRLGVRGNFGGLYNPYLSGTVYHEFSGDGDVTISQGAFSDSLSSTGKGTWVRLEGGLAGGQGTYGLNVAGWVDLGDTRGAGIRAGFRF